MIGDMSIHDVLQRTATLTSLPNIQDPFTHIYQFDLGFPPVLQQSIARKFNCRFVAFNRAHI